MRTDAQTKQGHYTKLKLPMTLRIGVAGHRSLPESQLAEIRRQLSSIYGCIDKALASIADHPTRLALYDSESACHVRLTSSLAEGADRVCIDPSLIPFEFELAAILPFEKNEYAKDFSASNSVIDSVNGTSGEFETLLSRLQYGTTHARLIEMDGRRAASKSAYDDCGSLLIEHSDILIAVYDGDHSEPHGSSFVVDAALAAGIPVVWVDSRASSGDTVAAAPTSKVIVAADNQEQVEKEVRRILLFEDFLGTDANHRSDDDHRASMLERVSEYQTDISEIRDLAGSLAEGNSVSAYPNIFSRCFGGFKALIAHPQESAPTCPADGDAAECEPVMTESIAVSAFSEYLKSSDLIASRFANLHRSTFLAIYCIAAVALILAVLSLALKSKLPGAVPFFCSRRVYPADHRVRSLP